MSIEIGSLVVRGSFGSERPRATDSREMEQRLAELRADILDEVRDLIEAADRRAREI